MVGYDFQMLVYCMYGQRAPYDFPNHNLDTRIDIRSDRKVHIRIARSDLSFQTLFHILRSRLDLFAASDTPSNTCSWKDQ